MSGAGRIQINPQKRASGGRRWPLPFLCLSALRRNRHPGVNSVPVSDDESTVSERFDQDALNGDPGAQDDGAQHVFNPPELAMP